MCYSSYLHPHPTIRPIIDVFVQIIPSTVDASVQNHSDESTQVSFVDACPDELALRLESYMLDLIHYQDIPALVKALASFLATKQKEGVLVVRFDKSVNVCLKMLKACYSSNSCCLS